MTARPDTLQGSLNLLILTVLASRPGLHGYAIMAAIREHSGDLLRVDQGSLYPALHRLEEAGWIGAAWVTKDTGRQARVYEVTKLGTQELAREHERWDSTIAAVNRVLRTV